MQFVLASHNKKKLAELSAIVSSLGIEIIPLPEGCLLYTSDAADD